MTIQVNPMREKSAATYNAAADYFDAPQLAFWQRHGQRAAELAALEPGDCVLDVGCGTGASALPAAAFTGPAGQVLGIDLAQSMLDLAAEKATRRGLRNIEFRLADMAQTGLPDARFDAVMSVFSIFFVPDIERQLAELWRLVRPGGRLVVTVWGPRAFQPAASAFAAVLRRVRPDIPETRCPWERLTEPKGLADMLVRATGTAPQIHVCTDRQALDSPEDWWTIAMGSGFRWEIDQLSPTERLRVKHEVCGRLKRRDVSAVETNALHAVALKR